MIIKNCRIIYKDKIEWGNVRVVANKIAALNGSYEMGEKIIDAEGLYLAPGFIDAHIHGAGGYDTLDGNKEAIEKMAQTLVRYGVTSFVPTTMTVAHHVIRKALEAIRLYRETKIKQMPNVLGVHLEGPFISDKALGAQHPKYLLTPSRTRYNQLVTGYEDLIKVVTLAPELEEAEGLIKSLTEEGVICAAGHTSATYEQMIAAKAWGIKHVSHLYNAMTGFSHREPGVVGAVFDSDITTELIADGIHVSYPAIRVACKQKGTHQMMLVSDAMMAAGMPEGKYALGGQEVYVKEGAARLANGVLAGSILTLDVAIKNVYAHCNLPLHEVVRMATYNPAKHCKVHDCKGLIEVGYDADLVLFNEDIQIKRVFIGGQEAYSTF